MKIFPAIDIVSGKAVRLYKGDYDKMTVYNDDPLTVAQDFENAGAGYIHLVDLEGAKTGQTPNIETVRRIAKNTNLFSEIGGGIRSMDTVEKYLNAGVDRVILGTSAVTDREFLKTALKEYGEKIAVGVDIKEGFVAIKGWLEASAIKYDEFLTGLKEMGVNTAIVTDISKDGAMKGTNRALYAELSKKLDMDITASGGVSSIEDIIALRELGLYAAIIGKAYYTGAIDLKRAIEVAR